MSNSSELPQQYPSASVSMKKNPPRGVRSSLKAFISADQSLTQPVRGVGRLAQKQFSSRKFDDQLRQRIKEKEEAHQVLNFALQLAETMFHCGADTIDVDSAVVSVCSAFGLDDIEVDVTSQSVIINYVSDVDVVNDQTRVLSAVGSHSSSDAVETDRVGYTVMRVVRSWSENYAGLEDIYRLIGEITHRRLSRKRAERRLTRLVNASKPYSPLVLTLAYFLTAAFLTLALGGSWVAAIISGLTYSVIFQVNTVINRLKVPPFFNMFAGSFLVTLTGLYLADESSFLTDMGITVSAQYIVAAGLIILLPTSRMVSTVQDALTGFPLTAAGKFISTGLSLLGLGIGMSSAVAILQIFGMGNLQIQEDVFHPANTWKNFIFMLMASVCIGIIYLARTRALGWIILISTCGIWVTNIWVLVLGEGTGRASAIAGALVVGMLSTYLAFRLQAPASMFYVPSLTFLLPGLFLFRGLYLFTDQTSENSGFLSIFAAVTIVFGIAVGVVLGSFLMQYLMQKFGKSEKLETVPLTTLISVIHRP